jgi:DNA mismatch repair protein MutL
MGSIRVLPDSVARKIAAGEVIERPASVVKELVENSLDAGARRILIEVDQGGRSRIAVTDDGGGIAREDVSLAFEPHATSKIRTDEDLLTIATLGFRGEALPSIAAVAEVEIWTARRGDACGTHALVRAGRPLVVEDVGTAVGCRIEARDLFSGTPARRKFLKAPSTEVGHVIQGVGRLALAHPEVGFALRVDGRDSLSLPPDGARARIRRVLGAEIEAKLKAVDGDGDVRVRGFVTEPHFTLASSRSLLFFVNGRLVRDRVLQHALLACTARLIPSGRYPAAVLFLDLPSRDVDVNVHPAKLEVRFRDPRSVHEAIGRAVRAALSGASPALADLPVVGEGVPSVYGPGARTVPAESRLLLVPPPSGAALPLPFAARGFFSSLQVIGQIFDGYLVCEGEGEVLLIDQHAAHERVAFERLRVACRAGGLVTQVMLVPQPIEVGVGEVELLAAAASDLSACGLELESFGERTVLVRAVPAQLPLDAVAPLVRGVAADLGEAERSRALESRMDALLATIACHSVVRVGQRLSEAEMRALLEAMDSVDLNSTCPHGRPVARRLSRVEIERRFGR